METELIKLRSRERLLALALAGVSIVLGFFLFLFSPDLPNEATADIEYLSNKLMIANVGPGIFFALFGAITIVYSIVTQANFQKEENKQGDSKINFQFLQSEKKDEQELTNIRARYLRDFRIFSRVVKAMEENKGISTDLKLNFETSADNVKQELMRKVWSKDWGDYSEFNAWLEKGCPEPPPNNIKEGADFFKGT